MKNPPSPPIPHPSSPKNSLSKAAEFKDPDRTSSVAPGHTTSCRTDRTPVARDTHLSQQKDGDSPVENLVTSLLEKCRCDYMKKEYCAPPSTFKYGNQRWAPQVVDADCHAFYQAIFHGIDGHEWETMYYHHKGSVPGAQGQEW